MSKAVRVYPRGSFTLIELVMVILIISIVSAAAIPKYLDLRREAYNAAALATIGGLRAGIAIYYAVSTTPPRQCLCLANSDPDGCNSYRTTTVDWPCYPANVDEVESLVSQNFVWPQGGGGFCYDPDTGQVVPCP